MNSFSKKRSDWIQYGLLIGLILVLFFTDLGTTIRAGMQQLVLKTGLKNAPTSMAPNQPSGQLSPANYPYSLTLHSLNGRSLHLADLKGKVVFLNQWASWCPPCRAEMPAIEKLYQSVDTSKVAFVMLSLDEGQETAQALIQQNHFTFPVYLPASQLPDAFTSQAIPTTIILKPDGQIDQRIEGMANYDTDEFRDYLASLYSPTH